MIFEVISTTIMGGIAVYAKLQQNGGVNDSAKIQKIFTAAGLNVKDGKDTYTAQLVKKVNYDWGIEYRYRLPLGKSFEDYAAKKSALENGLKNKRTKIDFKGAIERFKQRDIKGAINTLGTKKKLDTGEIEMFYDGLLKIRVYNDKMPEKIEFDYGLTDGMSFPVGQCRTKNEILIHDFNLSPHISIGGATRYGKSNLLNMIICNLSYNEPEHVHFYLVDLKGGVEFGGYENMKQVKTVALEPEETLNALKNAAAAMAEMRERVKSLGKRKIQETNIRDRHFIIIDEMGELNPNEAVTKEEKALKQECQTYISKIARLGGAFGFHLVMATQYPTGDVIPRQAKQNSDTKISFRVATEIASRVVLDSPGAEQLPQIKGRAIVQSADKRQTAQTFFISNSKINDVIDKNYVQKEKPMLVPEEKEEILFEIEEPEV